MSRDDLRGAARAADVGAFLAREVDQALATARPSEQPVAIWRAARARDTKGRVRRLAFFSFLGTSAALGACAVIVLVVSTLTRQPPPVLSYTVDGALPPADGYVRSLAAQRPTLAFSDGTDIQMMPKARARVLEVGRQGAHLMLEEGRAHVHVAHRPGADWQLQAGSFVVHVHGTSFFIEWNAAESRLNLQMESGVVSVDGTRPGESVTLRAGQSLSARAGEAPTLATAEQGLAVRVPSSSAAMPAAASMRDEAQPAAPQPAAPPSSASRPVPSGALVLAPLRPRWSDRLADGDATGIVAEAQRRGLAVVVSTASSEDLAALADAARFRKQDRLAERVLRAQRNRFPGTVRAEEASFLLGRLADGPAGRDATALAWYDRYLREAPSGAYADEAMGRMIIVLQRQRRTDEARKLAMAYLRRFPHGSYAGAAQAVTALGP